MLGLAWDASSDNFVFYHKDSTDTSPFSKRNILSSIAQLFDALGWLAPVVVSAKIFMQSLWLLKLGCDDALPTSASSIWRRFYSDLPRISELRIPRWLGLKSVRQDLELHGFSDASKRAYAAVVNLCIAEAPRRVTLVAAKTKVAPVQQVSLPRLELCAAQLLAKLVRHVCKTLALNCSVYLWSDSTVTLAWICGLPTRWKTYVANRVSVIQRTLPDVVWRHVESQQNPADCASRGLLTSELKHHELWWNGPHWLQSQSEEWPVSYPGDSEDLPEQRVLAHVATTTLEEPIDLLTRYSGLLRLQRVTAWCLRFIKNLRHRSRPDGGRQLSPTLLATELRTSLQRLICLEQSRVFRREIGSLKGQTPIPKGPLVRLNPFFDDVGQLRVGGRLKHSVLDPDEKHPVIIPRESPLTALLVDKCHRQTLHGGTQVALATLRQGYWLIAGRSAVKAFIGVDYAGPIWLRTTKGRGHKAYKGYISVFVCFATHAVHLEAVSDCTTEGFLAAYERFTSRRGLCSTLSSDCGTNFVGADTQLRNLFAEASSESQDIRSVLANDAVD